MWKILIVPHTAYLKRYSAGEKSGPKGKSESFEDSMAAGGDSWRYKSIQFKKRESPSLVFPMPFVVLTSQSVAVPRCRRGNLSARGGEADIPLDGDGI